MLRHRAFGIFLYNDFQLNVQELRLQAWFLKGLDHNELSQYTFTEYRAIPDHYEHALVSSAHSLASLATKFRWKIDMTVSRVYNTQKGKICHRS